MSWAATSEAPAGEDVQQFKLQSPADPSQLDKRGAEQMAIAAATAHDLVRSLREEVGYDRRLVVHCYGHAQPKHDTGDSITITVSS